MQNGSAVFAEQNTYLEWYEGLTLQVAKSDYKHYHKVVKEALGKPYMSDYMVSGHDAMNYMFTVYGGWCSYGEDNTEEAKWNRQKAEKLHKLHQLISMQTEMHQPLHVKFWIRNECAFLYFGNPDKGIFVPDPEKYLIYVPEKDYSALSPADVRAMLEAGDVQSSQQIVPQEFEAVSVQDIRSQKIAANDQLSAIRNQMNLVNEGKAEGLTELMAEIEAKQRQLKEMQDRMMADLDQKKAELEQQVEAYQKQIFLLDAQIYAIRCYAGDVVKFAQIKKGKNAPNTEPIVIHQKLRYLDEDLGRLASLYEIQWDEVDLFESFLKHSPLALDTFAPNERCVVLVRLSKTAKTFGVDNTRPYQNMLRDYDYYHGKTVGIIVRNGENLYLGWTEEERVQIEDDLILGATYTETKPGKELSDSDKEYLEAENSRIQRAVVQGLVSRAYVYNVLQGIVDNSDLLPLPKGVMLSKESEYVKYSMADRWLTDNRFGSFNDIIDRCNNTWRLVKGDYILTTQRLRPESIGAYGYDKPWNNERGRGEKNRTHNVVAADCTIYPVNLVEDDEWAYWVSYKMRSNNGLEKERWNEHKAPLSWYNKHVLEKYEDSDIKDIEFHEQDKPAHIFISLKKDRRASGWTCCSYWC